MGKISMILGLQDKVSPALSKIEKQAIANVEAYKKLENQAKYLANQMKELANMGEEDSAMYKHLETATTGVVEKMAGLVDGTMDAKNAFEKQTKAVDPLTSSLIKLGKAYLSIQGARKLIGMSDTYVQTHARLGLITKDVDGLEKQIYQSAQRTRVPTQSLSETVTKLGMQAGEAFNNSTDEILAFTETLNKAFTVSGMDASSISSVMYNMTQSLSTGHLLGNDYRILKMNSPMIIKYLREYYGNIGQAELDAMVSKGKVTAQDLKNAMFKASDQINEEFEKMPVTFQQAWTKFSNTVQRLLIPVLKALSKVADGLDTIFTFLSEHQYVLYAFAGAIALITLHVSLYKLEALKAAFTTKILGNAAAMATLKFSLWIIVITALIAVLLYLWNTNDEAAEKMLETWDKFVVGIKILGMSVLKVVSVILKVIETMVGATFGGIIGGVNLAIEAMNKLDGGNRKTIDVHFASNSIDKYIDDGMQDIMNDAASREMSRDKRVRDRVKPGFEQNLMNGMNDITSLIGTDSAGNSALKTTTSDDLLKEEDIQLLLDVATRDFKLNYQQITPEIAVTFGDVRETADVDKIMDEIANRVQEIYDADLQEVSYGY